MAKGQSYQYLDLAKPILPYISYTSPVNEAPHFIQGSQNIMASQIGYLEKRPGFSTLVGNITGFFLPEVKRIFTWRRWNGSFFVMQSALLGGQSFVLKLEVGVDANWQTIWQSTSDIPYDFVVSDNFCFFGNTVDMRKYDGTTVSKWGCDAPSAAPSVALQSGGLPPGMVFTDPVLSGTPTLAQTSQITFNVTDALGNTTSKTMNFVVNPSVLTVTTPSILPEVGTGAPVSITLNADYGSLPYTWSLFSGSIPPGMSLSSGGILSGTPTTPGPYSFAAKVTDSLAATAVQSFSIYVVTGTMTITPGSPLPSGTVGVPYSGILNVTGGILLPYTWTYLGIDGSYPIPFGTFPPGMTFTPSGSSVNLGGTPTTPGIWGFRVLVTDSSGNSQIKPYTLTINPTTLTIINIELPDAFAGHAYSQLINIQGGSGPYTITAVAGTLDGQTGYIYGYSYTTIYGHESNVSPLSDTTGIFTSQDPTVLLTASNDSQVNGINVYRTTDGGVADPAIMRLVASLPNINQTFQDSTQDIFLGTQTGPGFLINTPPTPTRGFVWSNGRIYGFMDNKTYYSGLEEVSNGIPEEAWPSGADGNFYAWPSQVGGMAVTENGVDIGLSEQFWQVSGDSLDTFRKSLLLDKAGTGSPTCINAVGNSVQWVDSSKQVWSSSLGEIGEPIRLDLQTIQPDSTFIGYHKYGNFNWIYVLDALNQRLYIFDLDTNQWYPPWTIAATAIWSGETSVGVIQLMVAVNSRIFALTPGTYGDGFSLTPYEDDIKTNLVPISAGRTTTGRTKMDPSQVEEILFEMAATDFEGVFPALVAQLCDDDPITADFYDWFMLTANNVTPQYIPRRKKLCQYRFITDSNTDPAIRAAFWIQWPAQNIGWKVYSLSISWITA